MTRLKNLKRSSKKEIASLFDRWNTSLKSGDPDQVVKNYAKNSILLGTLSNKPRLTVAEKDIYPALKEAIAKTPRRVVVTSFASHVHRIQQGLSL